MATERRWTLSGFGPSKLSNNRLRSSATPTSHMRWCSGPFALPTFIWAANESRSAAGRTPAGSPQERTANGEPHQASCSSFNPGTGQSSIAISRPLPDKVTNAVAAVRPAEADVGGEAVGQRHVADDPAVRRDHADAAMDQRRDAEVAERIDRHRIEALVVAAGEAAIMRPPCGEGQPSLRTRPGASMSKAHTACAFGFGVVEAPAVGRQADAVGGHHRPRDHAGRAPVGAAVEDAAAVELVFADLAEGR